MCYAGFRTNYLNGGIYRPAVSSDDTGDRVRSLIEQKQKGNLDKGEEKDHLQRIKEKFFDCNGDTLLYCVEQAGGVCHTAITPVFTTHMMEKPLLKRYFPR